ncbi:hypothetical protein [Actinophytocola algeriensis]|uniref:Uncharacterized protein n=1 Tax=Actinophytocola algeriensis TaxID=1768010 RepID=A0A7W7Q204_9PSEU|nr:hypothetical protein [Actinophytocola algeriensis]MBB4905408.1 hypothetical protein [Actinophytocola algeriensis]MBE1472907.1 hypothetical protein [Actinophytocola algeriensis]
MTAELDPFQYKVLHCLEEDDFALSAEEIAMDIFHNDEQPPSDEEERSVHDCLIGLQQRGLATSWQTNIADFGVETVWHSLLTPGRRVFDPGR